MTSEEIKHAVLHNMRITEKELFKKAYEANEAGKTYAIIMKIKSSHFKEWHDKMTHDCPEKFYCTLEEETTYLTSTDNKAFKSGMGGYSIFGRSLASIIRQEDHASYGAEIDRIERMPVEYAIILEDNQ